MQAARVEDDDVVKTFAADGSDPALDERILPRRTWCREQLLDAHAVCGDAQVIEGVIAIMDQVSGGLVAWERFSELLRRPRCRRMRRDRNVPDPSPVMGEEDEDEQQPAGGV